MIPIPISILNSICYKRRGSSIVIYRNGVEAVIVVDPQLIQLAARYLRECR